MRTIYYYQTFVGLQKLSTHLNDIDIINISSIHFDEDGYSKQKVIVVVVVDFSRGRGHVSFGVVSLCLVRAFSGEVCFGSWFRTHSLHVASAVCLDRTHPGDSAANRTPSAPSRPCQHVEQSAAQSAACNVGLQHRHDRRLLR